MSRGGGPGGRRSRSVGFELYFLDDELAPFDDLDPPRSACGAGEIGVLADVHAAAVRAADLHGDDDDLEPGGFGQRPFLIDVEGRFEEVRTTPDIRPTLSTTFVTRTAPCARAFSSRTSKTDAMRESSCTGGPQAFEGSDEIGGERLHALAAERGDLEDLEPRLDG